MNKITKKLCGILCASVMMLTIGTAKAYEANYGVLVINNGNFITTIDGLHSFQSGLLGDVNHDSRIDLSDVQYILRYSLGMTDDGISDEGNINGFKRLADVDGDGTITKADAEKLLRVYLKIESLDYSTVTWTTNNDSISSLKYLVINGNSELYSLLKEYYDLADSVTIDNYTTKTTLINAKKTEIYTALSSSVSTFVTSPDNKTMEGSLGTTKVDDIYIATFINDSEYNFYKFDVSNDNNWKFLSSKSSTNTNPKTARGDASTNVSNNTTIDNSKTTGTDGSKTTTTTTTTTTTEETVENPKTAVTLTIIGLVIAAVAGTIVAKKKNLFNRI